MLVAAAAPAQSAPPTDGVSSSKSKGGSDNPEHPLKLAQKKAAQKKEALERRLKGDKAFQGKVAKVGKGQYVELQREATDPVFVMLVEFGNEQYPNPIFQGAPPDGSTTDVTGPLHNEIPEPDRSVDNSTLWQADYDVLAIDGDVFVAHGRTRYLTDDRKSVDREFANVFVCRFDEDGRCREFTEYYMRRRPEPEPDEEPAAG